MWLKFVLGGALIAFCVLLGYFAAGKYRSRKKFYAQFHAFNERYLTELSYARKPLSAFLKEYEYTGDFAKSIKEFEEKRELRHKLSFLNKDEQGEFSDYLSMLGKGDAQSQKGYFTAKKGVLEEKKTSSEKEAKDRSSLYLKLGLLAGLAFVILIV